MELSWRRYFVFTLLLVLPLLLQADGIKVTDETSLVHEMIVQQCIYELDIGQPQWASQTFKELNDNQELDRIVTVAYKHNLQIVTSIFEFVKKLPSELNVKAYEIVFSKVKQNPYETMIVEQLRKAMPIHNNYRTSSKGKATILYCMPALITKWAEDIHGLRYPDINAYNSQFSDTFNITHLTQLITTAYSIRVENLETVINFIRSLPETSQVKCYNVLIESLEKHDKLYTQQGIRLAYQVKKDSGSNSELKYLKRKFPESIQTIIWTEIVCITNRAYWEYLYAAHGAYSNTAPTGGDSAGHYKYTKHRSVFTWTSGGYSDGKMKWQLKSFNNAENFQIVNKYYENELLVIDIRINNARVYVDSELDGVSYSWKFELVKNTDYVLIKNVNNHEYLYATSNTDGCRLDFEACQSRRYVHVGKNVDFEGHWTLRDCSTMK